MTSPPVLASDGLVKTYGSTNVVQDISIKVHKGEILALLGENGAGKSTLVKMLSGIVRPDEGSVLVDGYPVVLADARAAARNGIHLVHQELALLGQRSVTENIFLGQELRNRVGLLDWKRMDSLAKDALSDLGTDFSVARRVSELSTAGQQMVEIARAIVTGSRVVILDEPTAALSPADANRLFDVVRKLRDRGVAFIYISHRLDEVKALTDRVVVMKDGRFVSSALTSTLSEHDMVTLMVGRELVELFPSVGAPISDGVAPVLEVDGLVAPPMLKHASFALRPGEIVGIYGLEGHGQDEILACIAGDIVPFSGSMTRHGRSQPWPSIAAAIASGIGYVPSDRKNEGLVLEFSGAKNITLPILRHTLSRWTRVRNREENTVARDAAERSGVRGDLRRAVASLSGGNQQKVVFSRWLAAQSEVLLLNQPTRGVDIGAKAEIYRLVRSVCSERGAVALVVSREISELLGLCDRVLVMSFGRMVGEHGRNATEEEVLATAVGGPR